MSTPKGRHSRALALAGSINDEATAIAQIATQLRVAATSGQPIDDTMVVQFQQSMAVLAGFRPMLADLAHEWRLGYIADKYDAHTNTD